MVTTTDFEIPLCIATFAVWASMALLATELVEKKIEQNIQEESAKLSQRGKVIKPRRIEALNWPKVEMKQASNLWVIASILLGADIVLRIQNFSITFENSYDVLFYAGLIATIGAGIYSYRLFEFIIDRKYRPTYGFPHLMRATAKLESS